MEDVHIEKIRRLCREDITIRTGMDVASVPEPILTARVWNDGSIGMHEPGKMYLSEPTPGYIVQFHIGREFYEYHTDATGSRIRFGGRRPDTPQRVIHIYPPPL